MDGSVRLGSTSFSHFDSSFTESALRMQSTVFFDDIALQPRTNRSVSAERWLACPSERLVKWRATRRQSSSDGFALPRQLELMNTRASRRGRMDGILRQLGERVEWLTWKCRDHWNELTTHLYLR